MEPIAFRVLQSFRLALLFLLSPHSQPPQFLILSQSLYIGPFQSILHILIRQKRLCQILRVLDALLERRFIVSAFIDGLPDAIFLDLTQHTHQQKVPSRSGNVGCVLGALGNEILGLENELFKMTLNLPSIQEFLLNRKGFSLLLANIRHLSMNSSNEPDI